MKLRIILQAFLSISLLWPISSSALSQDLGPWRMLSAEEEKARVGNETIDSVGAAAIEADFDGDGRKDKALIAIQRSNGVRGLIAVLNGRIHVIDPDGIEPSDGLRFAKPGRWTTVCGNAFREFHEENCKDYPSRVMLKNPGILWIGNGRTVLYFWDRKARRFDGVLMVD